MNKTRYVWTVLLPAFLICLVFGKPAKAIEAGAKKVKLKCLLNLKKALEANPEIK
ncbi:hypothetical protein [Pantoea rwandensis]|uniref:hypothetical protein n=1 Tax=Pantoea rwandensis TaxID=1076550 RepID=UPI00146FA58E|nr:hypothetical protein [Pantoea rwandensis]